jgi:hypothetical protein
VHARPYAGRLVPVGRCPVAVPGEGHQQLSVRVRSGSSLPEGGRPDAAGVGAEQLMLAGDPSGRIRRFGGAYTEDYSLDSLDDRRASW